MSLKHRVSVRRSSSLVIFTLIVLGLMLLAAGCSLSPSGSGVEDLGDKEASLAVYPSGSSQTAKTGVLTGVVKAKETGYVLRNATVRTSGITAVTDSYGRYYLKGVPYGTLTITYSASGRNTQTLTYAFAGRSVTLKNVYLGKTPLAPSPAPEPSPSPAPSQPADPPVISEPPVSPVPAPSNLTAYEQNMVDLINKERTSRGLRALQVDLAITEVARKHSQEMIDLKYFSHNSPRSGSPFDRLKAAGISYSYAGENIAGNRSVEAAHTSLMNSEGHRANILNSKYTHIGLGIKQGGTYGMYFTQMFVGR